MAERIFLGVDGGATGTRARAVNSAGQILGEGQAGPSNLNFGIETAWQAVASACVAALGLADPAVFRNTDLNHVIMACGIAGAANPTLQQAFLQDSPKLAQLELVEDALTMLIGAHGGEPGVVVAIGTGTIGYAVTPAGLSKRVGGWGFPVGDEGSGAWLGWRALSQYLQQLDGRAPAAPDNTLYEALGNNCGTNRVDILNWLARTNSTKYATLAPLVVAAAASGDQTAQTLMREAGIEIERIAQALDPAAHLPLALTGGLAQPMQPYLPQTLLARCQTSKGTALDGAILLAQGINPVKTDC